MERYKIIHGFMPPGRTHDLMLRLKNEKGIPSSSVHHARGGGISTRKGRESFYYTEREVITLVVPEARADEIFEFVFHAAGLNEPHAGMLLMEKSLMAAPMILPEDVPDEE